MAPLSLTWLIYPSPPIPSGWLLHTHTVHSLECVCVCVCVCSLLSVVIVLDLSKPEQLWNCLQIFIEKVSIYHSTVIAGVTTVSLQLRSRVSTVLREAEPDLVQQMRERAWSRFGRDHPDRDLLDPLPLPLAILGSKYDIFQNMEPEKKKMVCRTLRFVAHTNGASLYVSIYYTDTSDFGTSLYCICCLATVCQYEV